MQRNLPHKVHGYMREHLWHKRWQRVVSILACVVVFCTTYALILPAVTMTEDTYCGLEEHTHIPEECYERVLICGYGEDAHQHTEACYETRRVLVCGQENQTAHTHSAECYGRELICGQEEQAAHTHSAECYVRELTCGQEEQAAHTHSAECYVRESSLTCGQEEQAAHTHGAECCVRESSLTCGQEENSEHTHSESCYTETERLVCTQAETEGHTHSESCYTETERLVCTQAETEGHAHGESCYAATDELACTQAETEGHTHSESCYAATDELICGRTEIASHTHGEGCYAATGELICTQAETHTHSDSCYQEESVLICEKPAQAQQTADEAAAASAAEEAAESHVHTDECYEETLICEKEEHIHSLACYSNPEADVESADVWERTLPQNLGDNWAENLVEVAKSQLGYRASTENYVVLEDGVTMKGYTRYGAWYGLPYEDWCAMFASFCLNYAGVPESAVPRCAGCQRWIGKLQEAGLYESAADCIPEPGYLIFFDWEDDGSANHVGIVTEVTETEEGLSIKTIEGNSGSAVKERSYLSTDSVIIGYCVLPRNPNETVPEETPAVTKTAEIYTDETYAALAEDATVITLTGNIPEQARVVAYPRTLELGQVVCAYDITILQEDGTPFEPDAEHPISVCIQLPDVEQEEQAEMTVCYVTEDGEIEQLPTQQDENGLSFEAEHFSTYAVLAASTNQVSSLWQLCNAFSRAASGDVIQLGADITISSDNGLPLTLNTADKAVTLDLNGRHITISGNIALFKVQNGSLTIKDSAADSSTQTGAKEFSYKVMESKVTNASTGSTSESTETHTVKTSGYIQGGSAAIVTVTGGSFTLESGLLCDGTGRAVDQSGGTVNLSGGYIRGFTKKGNINSNDGFGGAVRITNGTLNLSGTVLCSNQAPNGGAIYNNGGTLIMTGGVISGNTSTRNTTIWNNHSESATYRCGGGGIYADNASKTTISGGYVTCNNTTDTGYFDGGGGIFFSGTSTVKFTGGYITGNTAAGGGGVRADFRKDTLKQNTRFEMSGGYLSGNAATAAEGGGANFDRGCTATITGGHITNNQCTKGEHWGGGGLFGADGSTLNLRSALITSNSADGFGAGIGGCSTGRLYLYVDEGCAVYGNTASGKNYAEGGAKEDGDKSRVLRYPAFLENGYQDFFCALRSAVIGTMLGNNAAGWQGTADGKVVSLEKDEVVSANQLMGLTAHPTQSAKGKAQELAKLYINGNYAYTHGGGVMCNGNLIVGVPENITNPAYLAVKGTKQLLKSGVKQSLEGKTFTFKITDAKGNEVSTGTSDENGNITFDSKLRFDAAGTYIYYIAEVQPEDSDQSIEYDTARYRITLTVTASTEKLYGDTTVTNHLISDKKVERSTDGGKTWAVMEAALTDGVLTLPTTDGASFTNKEKETVTISVRKDWQDEYGETIEEPDIDSITVSLYRDEEVADTQTLSKTNNWSYRWTGLETGHTYVVREAEVDGYTASCTRSTDEDGTITFVITNKENSTYVLPETGGAGTSLFAIGGTLLMAGSLLSGYVLRRKRERRIMR